MLNKIKKKYKYIIKYVYLHNSINFPIFKKLKTSFSNIFLIILYYNHSFLPIIILSGKIFKFSNDKFLSIISPLL